MYPICDMVEYASTRFISVWVQAITAAINALSTPTYATIFKDTASNENIGNNLATRYTPATTIVAACINAETGVGPSMASGNQICNGNIADLPAPPANTKTSPQVNADTPKKDALPIAIDQDDCALVNLSISIPTSSVSALNAKMRIPIKKPRSAKRVTINAFLEAATAEGLSK